MRPVDAAFAKCSLIAVIVGGSMGGTGCFARTFGGSSSKIALLAEELPEKQVKVLARGVSAEDCPDGPGYGDYAVAMRRALESVKGANVLLNVELQTVNTPHAMGAGTCVRVSGDAGRLR